jgi:hypothetical protein
VAGLDVRITGANDLAQVAGAINRLTPGLRKEFLGALRKTGKPTVAAVKAAAVSDLPRSGGLGMFVQKSSIGLRTRTAGKGVGVRFAATKSGHDIAAIDSGQVRKPLFGNRKHWYSQPVRQGFFSETIRKRTPQARQELLLVMETFLKRIKTESHT